jgi:hypothetical protein
MAFSQLRRQLAGSVLMSPIASRRIYFFEHVVPAGGVTSNCIRPLPRAPDGSRKKSVQRQTPRETRRLTPLSRAASMALDAYENINRRAANAVPSMTSHVAKSYDVDVPAVHLWFTAKGRKVTEIMVAFSGCILLFNPKTGD